VQTVEKLKEKFQERLLSIKQARPGRYFIAVKSEDIVPICAYLFHQLDARFLISAATDLRQSEGVFQVSHIFSQDQEKIWLTLQTKLEPDHPVLESLTPEVPGANWSEREMQDLMGIKLKGHPDPRRLVLADDWPADLYPLRKDFPYNYQPPPAPEQKPPLKESPKGSVVIPIGPFYPVLEEPAYFRLFVEGEKVVGCDYRGFYNHRGIEKLGDSVLTYNEITFLAERICGICGHIHTTCYCQAVENAAGIEIPRRAKYIRAMLLELERIHSHLLWLGIAGHIIGFDTVLMQTWRIREPVMWLCEYITGNRKTYGINLIGGVRKDITAEMHPKILEVIDKIEKETLAVADAIKGDTPLLMRLQNCGILSREDAKKICVVGPTARGSGVRIDARIDHPYAAYEEIAVKIAVYEDGDILARTLVRIDEIFEAIRLIREFSAALKDMPEGELITKVDAIPAGLEGISMVEAPRGEAIHYVLTGEENRPYRWRVRAPTYANLQAVPFMIQGQALADVPIAIGSFDPCFSCTERVETVEVSTGKSKVLNYQEILGGAKR
jgi:Ni,Fe-hydrogenase III large subunit/Ni,Fe-hydrogenase III component G